MKKSGSKDKSAATTGNKNIGGVQGGAAGQEPPRETVRPKAESVEDARAAVTVAAAAPPKGEAMAAGPQGPTDPEESAKAVVSEAQAEAARIRAQAAKELAEAEKLAGQLRTEADQYWKQMQKTVEQSRAALIAETEEARAALEHELVELRRATQTDIDKLRIPGLATSLDALDKAREALESNSEKLVVGLSTLQSVPPGAIGTSSGRDLSLDSQDMFSVRRTLEDVLVEEANASRKVTVGPLPARASGKRLSSDAPWGALAPPWTPGQAAADADGSLEGQSWRPTAASRGLTLFAVVALLVVAGLVTSTLHEVGEVKAALAEQRESLAKMSDVHGSVALAPAAVVERRVGALPVNSAAAVAPIVTSLGADSTNHPTGTPAAAPAGEAPAKVPSPIGAEPASAVGASATRATVSDADMASLQPILGNRSLTDWRKKHLILAGRRAFKLSKIDQQQLDALIENVNTRELPPVGPVEVEDLKNISRAQTILVACKVLDGGIDLQLGAGTRGKLKETAEGTAKCASTDEADVAAFDSLKADLTSESWLNFLGDDRPMQLVRAILK